MHRRSPAFPARLIGNIVECKELGLEPWPECVKGLIGNIVECKVNRIEDVLERVPGLIGNIVECKVSRSRY